MAQSEAVEEMVRGAAWSALTTVAFNAGNFLFWVAVGAAGGARDIGYATTAMSIAATIAGLANPGLGVAVLRELPARGGRALSAALMAAVGIGAAASALAVPFSRTYPGFGPYIPVAAAMIVAMAVGSVATPSLVAARLYGHLFTTRVLSVIVKLALGVVLLAAGMGGYGIALALLASIAAMAASSLIVAFRREPPRAPTLGDLAEILKVGLSNYPALLSTQLVVSAGTVLLGLLSGRPEYAGVLYISLMIVMIITSIPGSMSSIGLSLAVRGADPLDHVLRLGCIVAVPMAVLVGAASDTVLSLISRELTGGFPTLTLLTLSVVPQVAIQVTTSRLNARRQLGRLAALGASQLTALLAASILLVPRYGAVGAALAYLASNLAPTPLMAGRADLATAAKLVAVQTTALSAAFAASTLIGPLPAAIAATAASAAAPLFLGMTSTSELKHLARAALGAVSGRWRYG